MWANSARTFVRMSVSFTRLTYRIDRQTSSLLAPEIVALDERHSAGWGRRGRGRRDAAAAS